MFSKRGEKRRKYANDAGVSRRRENGNSEQISRLKVNEKKRKGRYGSRSAGDSEVIKKT